MPTKPALSASILAELKARALLKWLRDKGVPIMFHTQSRKHVYRRWLCFLIFRRWGLTYHDIAKIFGVDHSTVVYAVQSVMRLYPTLQRESVELEEAFNHEFKKEEL